MAPLTPRRRGQASSEGASAPLEGHKSDRNPVRAALQALKAKPRPAAPAASIALNIDAIIDKARSSGRLNLSGRSLQELPVELFLELLPASSPYYPQHAKTRPIDFDFGSEKTGWRDNEELRVLRVASNELSEVNEAVAGFVVLETLDLRSNLLTALPDAYCQLSALTSLHLAHNRFTAVPLCVLALANLAELDLSHNELTELWPCDWRRHIEHLDQDPDASTDSTDFLAHFPGSPRKPRKVSTDSPLPGLKQLNLSHNRFKTQLFEAKELLLPPLMTVLDLSHNALGPSLGMAALIACDHLVRLSLADNELESLVRLEKAPGFRKLGELDLQGNAFEHLDSVRALFRGQKVVWKGSQVKEPTTSSLTVDVTGNPLRDEAKRKSASSAEKGAEAAAQAQHASAGPQRGFSPLERALRPDGTVDLAGKTLDELPLSIEPAESFSPKALLAARNVLTRLPLDALATATWTSTLVQIDLSRNCIGSIEDTAGSFASLTELNLSANQLESSSRIISAVAGACPALQILDLSYNRLTTCDGIGSVLRGNSKTIRLNGNRVDDISALVQAAEGVRDGAKFTCTELDLRDNAIAKLPPQLGYLPLIFLGVEGNLFRIPPRKVYADSTGSTQQLLSWLKERA